MIVTETAFVNDNPVGLIRQDLFAGVVTFEPKNGHKRLASRKWSSVNACQRAVIKTYTKESPLSAGFLILTGDFNSYTEATDDPDYTR